MKKWTRDVRLIPLVLLATICLFVLKVSGLLFAGGYTLGERLGGANKSELTLTTADTIPDVTPIIHADTSMLGRSTSTVPWARAMFNFGGDASDAAPGASPYKSSSCSRVPTSRLASAAATARKNS